MFLDGPNLLERHDRELRAQPEASPGLAVERGCGVVSVVDYLNIVLHSDLRPDAAEAVVRSFAVRYIELGQELERDVYAHDEAVDADIRRVTDVAMWRGGLSRRHIAAGAAIVASSGPAYRRRVSWELPIW